MLRRLLRRLGLLYQRQPAQPDHDRQRAAQRQRTLERRIPMLLKHKVAVIHGAGGAVGGALARAFAREGAQVFLSGRSLANVDAVAKEIRASGGLAEAAVVDALDERAVDQHLN